MKLLSIKNICLMSCFLMAVDLPLAAVENRNEMPQQEENKPDMTKPLLKGMVIGGVTVGAIVTVAFAIAGRNNKRAWRVASDMGKMLRDERRKSEQRDEQMRCEQSEETIRREQETPTKVRRAASPVVEENSPRGCHTANVSHGQSSAVEQEEVVRQRIVQECNVLEQIIQERQRAMDTLQQREQNARNIFGGIVDQEREGASHIERYYMQHIVPCLRWRRSQALRCSRDQQAVEIGEGTERDYVDQEEVDARRELASKERRARWRIIPEERRQTGPISAPPCGPATSKELWSELDVRRMLRVPEGASHEKLTEAYGAFVMRLWEQIDDNTSEAKRTRSARLAQTVMTVYRRIDERVRATLRYVHSGNKEVDGYALSKLNETHDEQLKALQAMMNGSDPLEFARQHASLRMKQMRETNDFFAGKLERHYGYVSGPELAAMRQAR